MSDWSLVDTKSNYSAKAEARRIRREEYDIYLRDHHPLFRIAYSEHATKLYETKQKREVPEFENTAYDVVYNCKRDLAVDKATKVRVDCGRSVSECQRNCSHHERCESNRRYYYKIYQMDQ
jgi:hypothetical protein